MADDTNPTHPPAADWKASLPEDLRADPSIADVKDVAALVKSYRDTKSMVGRSLRIPGPDAGEDARREFKERLRAQVPELVEIPTDPAKRAAARKEILESLGWPKDPAKELTLEGIDLEPGVQLDENELRAAAVELGLDKDAFRKLATRSAAAQAKAIKEAAAEQSVLKGEWGATYEERRSVAASALEKTGFPAEMVQAVKDGKAPASFIRAAYGLAKSVGAEARPVGDGQREGGHRGGMTPTEALAQLAEIEARAEYLRPTSRTMDIHRDLVAKHAKLMRFAYPDLAE